MKTPATCFAQTARVDGAWKKMSGSLVFFVSVIRGFGVWGV